MKKRMGHSDILCHQCRSPFPIRDWTLETVNNLCKILNIICLSTEYLNQRQLMQWMCVNNSHKWESTLDLLIRRFKRSDRVICTECFNGKTTRHFNHSIDSLKELAASRGGKCISEKYVPGGKITFQCDKGHIWPTDLFSVIRGSWCPYCSSSISEEICREYFEQLFRKKFPKTRPQWLMGSKGRCLELDGYCEELNLAFEHQGEQHYNSSNFFHKTLKEFEILQKNDQLKLEKCNQRGVFLTQIPSLMQRTPLNRLKLLIKNFCLDKKIPLPENFDYQKIDLKKVYTRRT